MYCPRGVVNQSDRPKPGRLLTNQPNISLTAPSIKFTSLNNMLSNFSNMLIVHISQFTAVINHGGIGKASVASGKAPRRIILTFCNLQKTIVF